MSAEFYKRYPMEQQMLGKETRYFYDITPERILRAVESIGVRCTGRCLAMNSMENRVYDVEIEVDDITTASPRDRYRVVKFYRPGRWSAEQIQEEHDFLFDLAAADIPVIAPIKDEAGRSLWTDQDSGIFFTVFPKCGGRSPDEFSDEQYEWMGRLLARMHMVGAKRPAPHRVKIGPQSYGRESLAFLVESGMIEPTSRTRYIAVVEALCEICEPLFQDLPLQRIHGDCHRGNILWGNEGPFLVDFDDMVQGPPVQDMWLIVPGRDRESMIQLDLLVEGYEQMRSFDRRSLKLIEPLRALRLIQYCAWIGRRWSDPAFQRIFVHYNTANYWQQEIAQLEEQLRYIRELGGV